jgi:photosystem II stability/assembly factor-like uncharacterized protein
MVIGPKNNQVVGGRTTNAGKTWSVEKIPGQTTFALDCGSPTSCEASVMNASAAVEDVHTTNGGATWTVDKFADGDGFFNVSCATAKVCEGTGHLAGQPLMRTTDGGKIWKPQTP